VERESGDGLVPQFRRRPEGGGFADSGEGFRALAGTAGRAHGAGALEVGGTERLARICQGSLLAKIHSRRNHHTTEERDEDGRSRRNGALILANELPGAIAKARR